MEMRGGRKEPIELGREADIFQANVSEPEEVKSLFDYIREKHNKIDSYINDKGDFTPPLELVFSWFNKAVTENRKQKKNK